MNYKYKFEKYNSKLNNIIGGFIFTDTLKSKINTKINEIIINKNLLDDKNPSLQEIMFNDQNYIQFKTNIDTKYFLIDKYGNLVTFTKVKQNEELLKKIMNPDKIIEDKLLLNLENPEFDEIIENQIYLGLFYSKQKYIELFELDSFESLHVFTKTIVKMVLDKINSL